MTLSSSVLALFYSPGLPPCPWSMGGQYYFTERETEVPKELSDLQNVKQNFTVLISKLGTNLFIQIVLSKIESYLL